MIYRKNRRIKFRNNMNILANIGVVISILSGLITIDSYLENKFDKKKQSIIVE